MCLPFCWEIMSLNLSSSTAVHESIIHDSPAVWMGITVLLLCQSEQHLPVMSLYELMYVEESSQCFSSECVRLSYDIA